jgi:hypothetical protein
MVGFGPGVATGGKQGFFYAGNFPFRAFIFGAKDDLIIGISPQDCGDMAELGGKVRM